MTSSPTPAGHDTIPAIDRAGLTVDAELAEFVETELLSRHAIGGNDFWEGVARIVNDFTPRNDALLERRDELQSAIDAWHREHLAGETGRYRAFLEDIGYLQPPGGPFEISTEGVAPEIATVAGPQLVVPVTNARYAINAANARWGSLYDAVYGTNVLGDPPSPGPYDPARGADVIAKVRGLLDTMLPLEDGTHAEALRYFVEDDRLAVRREGDVTTRADDSVELVGWEGPADSPVSIIARHHGLAVEIVIDPESVVGQSDRAGVSDVRLESAITTIMDFEDSVAAVDGEDKTHAYRNWFGLLAGTLTAEIETGSSSYVRRLADDRELNAPGGGTARVPTRSVMLVRNVGLLMKTPALRSATGEVYEGILDGIVTVLCAAASTDDLTSVYVVKPKLHGPDEVRFTVELFDAVEDLLGLARNTVKIGIMDEERRTTLNLGECIRAARQRVVFINTGFLDRTGDEIHTSMLAGPMVPKTEMKAQHWIGSYERWNVEVGLGCGFRGRAQIGKGMWAAPDQMREMMAAKSEHPESGASCAWVPSPTAATLHAVHYHMVDVAQRQATLEHELFDRGPTVSIDDLLTIPLAAERSWTPEEVQNELDNNAQGILGYVVRWVDQGVGCSKVPDIHDVALMEDRATCRISSQHMANWLLHGVTSRDQVMETMKRMAIVVDEQNRDDPDYRPMAPGYDGEAFRAACDLVLSGTEQPSGYTEPILHSRRLAVKEEMSEQGR